MGTLTTEKDEALLRGYIPLAREIVEILSSGEKIDEIYFLGNGYVTDAVLQLIKRKCKSQEVFSGLSLVNFVGSDFITDYGVRCLLEVINGSSKLQEIDLSGCHSLSDSSLALLQELQTKAPFTCKLNDTSVTYLTGTSRTIETHGCPTVLTSGQSEDKLEGHLLIASHHSMKKSLGKYLQDGSCVDRGHGYHQTNVSAGSWKMAVTEVTSSSVLFDHLTNALHTQVIIPFEADADPKEVNKHILSTVAKIVAKEPVICRFPDVKPVKTGIMSSRPFLDLLKLDRHIMLEAPDGRKMIRNVSTSESSIGVYISRQPFTRSNNYFEVELKGHTGGKVALLLGCLYDLLYSHRHPMDSTSDHGGYVDGFESSAENKVIGFGIEGEWLSEYVPDPSAKYYFIENGEKTEGKVAKSSDDKPRSGMYPLVSVLGEDIGEVMLPVLVEPPKEVLQQWKKEERWIEKGTVYNCLVDNYGTLRYVSNYETEGEGYFLGMHEVNEINNSFSVELKRLAGSHGSTTMFRIGLAGEMHMKNKPKDSGIVQLSVKMVPFSVPWKCDKCNFENEAHSKTCESCKNGERPEEATNPKNWTCEECSFPNEKHVETCSSCKKGKRPHGFGEAKQEVFSKTNDQIDTKVVENLPALKEGDILTVKVAEFPDKNDGVTKIAFFHNNKQINYRNFTFSPAKKCRLVPYVLISSEEDTLVVKNFKPTYRQPAPYTNKVTIGRTNNLDVYDNGKCKDAHLIAGKKDYGVFMAKSPFNKDLLEFTVEATNLSSQLLFGIGACIEEFPYGKFLGWTQGSVGYHADNGGLYDNSSTGTFKDCKVQKQEAKIASGDVVSVKIGQKDDTTPLKFDAQGNLDSQQTVKMIFIKNDTVIHEILHEILGPSLYPAFTLQYATVTIRNFYAETREVWEDKEMREKWSKQNEEDKKVKSMKQPGEQKLYSGTEFMVVGVNSGASDVSGKLQIVQQQMDLSQWPELQNVTSAIGDMEKRLGELTLQDQVTYGQLCAVEDNMKLLASNPSRISFHKADLENFDMRQDLLTKIESVQESHRALQSIRYRMHNNFVEIQEEILKQVTRSKVIKVSQLLNAASGLNTEGKDGQDEALNQLKKFNRDGQDLLALIKDLQNKGQLLLLDLGLDQVIADIGFLLEIEGKLGHLLPTQMVDIHTMVRCIGQTSHVWSSEMLDKKILADAVSTDKTDDVKSVLEKVLALICVPCMRTTQEDAHCIYVVQQNITNPPVSMVQYWNPQMDNTDYIVMRQTYCFPLLRPEHLIALIISNTSKYGRMVILTGEGVVYQNGAVQTVIVSNKDDADKDTVLIESRCYMPDMVSKEECGMTKQTVSYVQDYTWNVFCIFTDIIDDFLRRNQIVTVVSRECPPEMVNVSVGCKHCWVCAISGPGVLQTVCTLCNRCCDKGSKCPWNGIMGDSLRQCVCGTDMAGCNDCGICVTCVEELWATRSRLRPYSVSMTEVIQTTEEKKKMQKTKEEEESFEILKDPVKQSLIALDPFCYNEVEFTNLSKESPILCLREESDGTTTQAFPGLAKKVEDLNKVTFKENYTEKYSLSMGDQIKLKITDPKGVSAKAKVEVDTTEESLVVEPQYFSVQAREVNVMQETGIVMYDTASTAIPVGQFIGCKPLTKENDTFSVKILCKGKKTNIAIGLVPANYPPNRQPGWNSQSIGYHADDGGIFLESGQPTRRTKLATEGDVMTLYIDFVKDKGWFRKNGEKCIELNLNPSRLGYYPCIGFHSVGEAVQILEKDLWTATKDEDRNRTQPSMPTYKYGNLWISPGNRITLVKLGNEYCGWLILHNPKKDPVGFKVKSGPREEDTFFGVIEPKKEWIRNFRKPKDALPEEVTIEWSSLESGRKYTADEMKILFGAGDDRIHQSGHQHHLPVALRESANIVQELPRVSSGEPREQSMCLHVYKNLKLVDEYWLKHGSYQVLVESNTKQAKFLLKYPKCPGFNYSKTFQKGMKLIAYLESVQVFAECIVVEVYSGGKSLALEYSPKDKTSNTTVCMLATSPALTFTNFEYNDSTVWPYEARNTPTNLTNTFFNAPPYLLSEGAMKVLSFTNKEWKSNVLKIFSYCYQVFTRLTVQEKHICDASRTPLEWVKNGNSYYLYTFLPSQLSDTSLIYPTGATMFSDIAVHRMCFSADELNTQAGLEEDVVWRIPLHYVDIPGIVPSQPLPPEASFGDGLIVWTYVSLISNRLFLPSYKNMIKGNMDQLSRAHVEQLLCNLLQTYSALCSIYSATWGGVEYSKVNEDRQIKEVIRHDDNHIVKFTGKPQTETDMLFKKSGFATCKAHCLAMKVSDDTFPSGVDFDYNYFEPYNDLVNMFHWSHTKLSGLPDDFFEKFKYLQYFRIGNPDKMMPRFEKLPTGIGSSKYLKVIELTQTGMTELPSDFFLCDSVVSIYCTNMAIVDLPKKWPENSQVSELVLAGLKLSKVPEELSKMQELERLELCYNPITDLPESMAELKKLKVLYLTGPHWLTLEGKKSQMTHEQYEHWHNLNPYIKNYLGAEKVEALFKQYDFNNNGSLDEEEIAALNLKLFFDMPRLGLADINDEVTGGIPQVIFSMTSLCELYLDYCAITMVPGSINNLQNLNTLSLDHNPLLMSLPGPLGHLPNIKGIQINSCPSIRTPPHEVVSRGFESVKAYLKRLAGGYTECRRTKLMVVGLGGAGKTSLLRALMSDNNMTAGTESEIPTDGIDIVPWTVTSEDGRAVTYSTWDFAGQAVYYNTHQFFLSKRAVYLLLWSMRQGYEHAGLDFWLSSICCHAPGTPILVVGTQCDLIPQAEIPEKELRERYPQIASFHQVSSIKGINIPELQKSLLDVTLQQGYMGEKIPQVWLNFEKRILAERLTKKSYIQWEVACQYAMEQGIYDEKDVRLAIQLLHDLGTVQYFDNDFLRNYVVINPQWIVNVMACVVSAQDSPIQKNKGRFLHKDIPIVWKDYDEDLHKWLLRLTEDFDLTFPLPKEAINIVPCLLPGEPPDDLHWPKVRGQQGIRETKMVYRFTYLPSGLFNRAQVRLFQFSDGKMIWKKGSLLSKNKHLALIKQTDSKELVVFVQGPRPENIVFLIHEVFESIIEESFNGVNYELFLPCPDCILKEGTSDPDLMNAKLIQRAKDMKAPFLQCYKYFHWISMAQLQEKLPADSREVSDFDMQLQQSIVALQELNNDLLVDIAIIYSSKDVPPPGDPNKLPPALVRDDIVGWGYSCWFADDMDTVSYVDLTAAIKNCKVLIVLISDDFEQDTKCRDMFLYAKETMNKDIIVTVIGESNEWEEKDLGIKIGKQERKLMVKTLPRYTVEGGRRDELKSWLEEKIAAQAKIDVSNLDVFVSYAWINSKQAQERSGKQLPNALGWGDPRTLKCELENKGVNCWLDIEQVGREKQGIFADMASGIRNSKVFLACISDEYAESDNCMMELRFGILNMNLPLVVAVVGSGSAWKETEVAMLLRRAKAKEIYLQQKNPEGVPAMIQFVKESITDFTLGGRKKKKKDENKDTTKSEQANKEERKEKEHKASVAYKEEYELVQRKFMRHILGSISTVDTMPLPRLMVVDFVKAVAPVKESDGRESKEGHSSMSSISLFNKRKLRPKSGRKSRDRLQIDESVFDEEDKEDWSHESFCMKLLCENEEGWHLCDPMFPLAFRTRDILETFLKKSAPYLYRIYSLLSQSPIKLKCFAKGMGQSYQDWIRAESESNLDFVGAMQHLRTELTKDEAVDFLGCLARCRLPSGKILWLCEQHQQQQHVAKLSTSSDGGSYNLQKVLFNEDKLFLENLEKSEEYKALKSKPSSKVAPKLPAPVPIPMFVPVIPAPQTEEKTPREEKKAEKTAEKKEEKPPVNNEKDKQTDKSKTEFRRELSMNRILDDKDNSKTEFRRQRSMDRERGDKDVHGLSLTTDEKDKEQERRRDDTEKTTNADSNSKTESKTESKIESKKESKNKDDLQSEKLGTTTTKETEGPKDMAKLENKALFVERRSKKPESLKDVKPLEKVEESNQDTSDGIIQLGNSLEIGNRTKDKQALQRTIKQKVIESTSEQSKISSLSRLIRPNINPGGTFSTGHADTTRKPAKLQHMGSSQNLGTLQKGTTVRRPMPNNTPGGPAQGRSSHRFVSGKESDSLQMSLKINSVVKSPPVSSAGDSANSSAKSGVSSVSKTKSKAPSQKSSLEKVRPRKITVAEKPGPSNQANNTPRKTLKATGIGVGLTQSHDMALPDHDGSKACSLQ